MLNPNKCNFKTLRPSTGVHFEEHVTLCETRQTNRGQLFVSCKGAIMFTIKRNLEERKAELDPN